MIEAAALKALADAAHKFALKWKPRPKITGAYERALNQLVQAARAYATKSDEQWAHEVISERVAALGRVESLEASCRCGNLDLGEVRLAILNREEE